MSRNITRGWCFTINNYTEADEHVVFEMEQYAKYVVCGRECGKWNTTPSGLCVLLNRKVNETNEGDSLNRSLGTNAWYRGSGCRILQERRRMVRGWREASKPKRKGERGKQSIEERWALAKGGEFERLPPEHKNL